MNKFIGIIVKLYKGRPKTIIIVRAIIFHTFISY